MNFSKKLIFEKKGSEGELESITKLLASHLAGTKPFVLWLKGEMGAGKTTLTRFLLRHFGLDKVIPVTSPTFSYINEYKINDELYIHMDLFRASEDFDPEDLGVTSDRQYRGFILEWPSIVESVQTTLPPTHKLDIEHCEDTSLRNYKFYQVVL